MILIRNLRLAPGEPAEALETRAAKKLGVRREDIAEARLVKQER